MPFVRSKYPLGWRKLSLEIRARAAGRCECWGECGADHTHTLLVGRASITSRRCDALNGQPHPITGSRVVLTVAHLCRCRDRHGVKCGDPTHLKAMCQRCHLAYDRADHIAHARVNRHARKAIADLFPDAR